MGRTVAARRPANEAREAAPAGTSGGAPAQRRELRAQGKRTMQRLLDAGLAVFRERGYPAARVDDVVRAAKTSHGTFYLYFANKEDLLRSLTVECAQEMHDLAESIGPIDRDKAGYAELQRVVRGFVEIYRRYGPVIRAWMEGQVTDREANKLGVRAFTDVANRLQARMVETGPTAGLDPAIAPGPLMAMLERVSYAAGSRDLDTSDATIATVATVVHRGFFGASATL